MNITWKNRK